MKSIKNVNELEGLIVRINKLSPGSISTWGKMNITQMLEHCTMSVKLALGDVKPELNEEYLKRGRLVKDKVFEGEEFAKELPTTKEFIIMETGGDFYEKKQSFLEYLKKFSEVITVKDLNGMHPVLGELNSEEWGILIWKHTNHHLLQFGV